MISEIQLIIRQVAIFEINISDKNMKNNPLIDLIFLTIFYIR